jgi:hypothetical protein
MPRKASRWPFHHFSQLFRNTTQFFTTRDHLNYLTGDRGFNRILADAPQYDEAVLADLADQMQDKLEKQGIDSGGAAPNAPGVRTSDPNKHFLAWFILPRIRQNNWLTNKVTPPVGGRNDFIAASDRLWTIFS